MEMPNVDYEVIKGVGKVVQELQGMLGHGRGDGWMDGRQGGVQGEKGDQQGVDKS